MSDQLPPPPAYVPTAADEYAFRRRRTHAHIEAMSGLILQAIAYPTRRHRDFICALQSANSGNEAKVPYTPFRRAHLTLADYMKYDGSQDSRRKAVYREICCLRRFQRTTGIVIFHVTPGNEEEATEYIDYLTPLADAAMQRALSSPLWKTDKAEAKREAVRWAVSMLPRISIEEDEEAESTELSLPDYERTQEERFYQSIERTADEIEKRGGDYRWIERVARQLLQIAASRKKTAGARRPDATLRAAGTQAARVEGGTAEESGDLYNVGQFRPVTESDTSERGEDRTDLPPTSDAAVADLDAATANGQGGRTELTSPPLTISMRRSLTRGAAGPSFPCTIRSRAMRAPAARARPAAARESTPGLGRESKTRRPTKGRCAPGGAGGRKRTSGWRWGARPDSLHSMLTREPVETRAWRSCSTSTARSPRRSKL